MKREHVVSTAITDDEHKKLSKILGERIISGEKSSMSIILREAIECYLMNGNSAPAQDDKQEPTTNPTSDDVPSASNPYSDLKF